MIQKLGTLGLCLLVGWGYAQVDSLPATSFSLEEAQQYALTNAYSMTDRKLDYEKARQTIRETASQGLPQISANFDYTYNPQIFQQPIPAQFIDPNAPEGTFVTVPFGVAHQNTAAINYNQLLIDGSYFVALQATKVYKEAARLDMESEKILVAKNVAQSYYGVLVAEEAARLLTENLASLQKNYDETQELYNSGFVEEQDVDQLELLVNNLNSNLNNAKRQIVLARQLLKFNMGLPIDGEIELSSTLEELIILDESATLLTTNFDYENHIDYQAILTQAKGARLQVSNQKAANYPTLSGFIRHNQSNFGDQFSEAFNSETWIPGTAIGLSLKWDLFTGLRRNATLQTAKLDLEKAELATSVTKNQLILNYNQAKSDYEFAIDNYYNQKRNIEVSKKIRDKTLIKYQEGINSSLELTQAENQYLDTQSSYLQAVQNLLNAKEELEKSLGNQ